MMTSAGAVLFWRHEVFANSMIADGSHPSYMDPNPPAPHPKPQLSTPSTDYAIALPDGVSETHPGAFRYRVVSTRVINAAA
jgi:hypothetical protein